jgi:hypothetical protein
MFGLPSAINGNTQMLCAATEEDSALVFVERETLLEAMRTDTALGNEILRLMSLELIDARRKMAMLNGKLRSSRADQDWEIESAREAGQDRRSSSIVFAEQHHVLVRTPDRLRHITLCFLDVDAASQNERRTPSRSADDRFRFQVFLQPKDPAFSANSRLFKPAEGSKRIVAYCIDQDPAGGKFAGHAGCPFGVS